MIEIRNISKTYKNGKKVIDNLNFTVNDGEIFGFLGKNGSGKTTTIKMIVGITNSDNGDIFIDGKSINNNPIEARRKIGYVSDNSNIFLKYKGIEYLKFMSNIYQVIPENSAKKIEYFSKKLEIYDVLNKKIETYSHGMKQKLMIIASLLSEPKNWILDEPFTGLDPKALYVLKEIMREISKEKKCTVFLSTHILEIAKKICDRVAIINEGKIVKILDLRTTEIENLEKIFMENIENEK